VLPLFPTRTREPCLDGREDEKDIEGNEQRVPSLTGLYLGEKSEKAVECGRLSYLPLPSHHQKVSIIAALCVAPERDRVHLYFRLHPNANVNAERVADFLHLLNRQLGAPVLLLWDRLNAHRARRVADVLASLPRLNTEHLPPYAPELNPVENVWSYLKRNPMANLALYDVTELAACARSHGRSVQRREHLLRSFIRHCPLSLRLK
jgi:transposase